MGEENTVYILKNINVGIYSVFYDTGCCDIISRYQADKNIWNRAIQELPGPISIGGVDNARVKSDHGDICQVKLLLHNGKNATLTGTCSDEITTFPSILCKDVWRVENDIKSCYKGSGRDPKQLPHLSK